MPTRIAGFSALAETPSPSPPIRIPDVNVREEVGMVGGKQKQNGPLARGPLAAEPELGARDPHSQYFQRFQGVF